MIEFDLRGVPSAELPKLCLFSSLRTLRLVLACALGTEGRAVSIFLESAVLVKAPALTAQLLWTLQIFALGGRTPLCCTKMAPASRYGGATSTRNNWGQFAERDEFQFGPIRPALW
jgi:hypothetical protein